MGEWTPATRRSSSKPGRKYWSPARRYMVRKIRSRRSVNCGPRPVEESGFDGNARAVRRRDGEEELGGAGEPLGGRIGGPRVACRMRVGGQPEEAGQDHPGAPELPQ